MVIAAFYVIGSDVRAETVDEPIAEMEEPTSAIEHLDRRLTISNDGASDPHIVLNGNMTYLLWVDGNEGSQRLMWKRSNDSLGTFTPDTALTSKFHSIDDLSLCCSDGCIAATFEARTSADSQSIVFYLYSSDGKEWSSAYSVAQGDSPVLMGGEGRQYLGMNIANEGQRHLSIASIIVNDDEINATFIANLPFASNVFDMFMTDDSINIAFGYEPSEQVLFMRLAENGTVVTSPSTICQTTDPIGLDLQMIDGALRLMIIERGSIRLARCLGAPEYWSVNCPFDTEGTITDASMTVLDENIRIAYAIDDENTSAVLYFDCDLQGQIVRDIEAISTLGLNASSPVLITTSPGVISILYVEEHYDAQELFLRYDIDFVIPDIPRLKKFIESLDEGILIEGNGSREKLIGKLDRIISYLENKNETAAIEDALTLKASIEAYFVYVPYADQETIQGSKDKIKKNLDSVKKDDSNDIIIMSLPPSDLNVVLSVQSITDVQSVLRMYLYSLGNPISGYITWGSSSSSLPNTINCAGSPLSATITGLNPNSTYYARGYMRVSTQSGEVTAVSQQISFNTYPSVLHVYSISVSLSSGSAVIAWTTDGKSDSRVDYGTTASYGSTVTSSTYSTSHSLVLNNLAYNAQYHYKITSAYSTTGFSLSAVTTDRTFTSATSSPVTITSVGAILTDLNAVRITWTTNVQATSVVYYGPTTEYGYSASGSDGTSHTVDMNGLLESTQYHYMVRSAAISDPNSFQISADNTFSTLISGDADIGGDAGDTLASSSLITPGSHIGYLDGSYDANDYFSIPLLSGETLKLSLDVPSNFDYHLYLYNPSGTQVASSTNGVGLDESIQYAMNANGIWKVRVFHQSGTGQGLYGLNVQVLGAWEHHYLDVGTTGDNDVIAHTPGLAIMDGTGWYAASSGMRETARNGSFLLNIYDGTYQSNSYYEVAIAYTSSADVGVSVLVGESWVSVATLPGRSIAWTYSFVLKSDMLSDSSSTLYASNVRMRFDHQVVIDSIDAMPIAYASDFFGGSQCNPGVMLENNWQIGSAVVNGSTYATLIVSLPRTDITYFLEFQNLDSCHGIGVQQWDGSSYDSIGTLESWGTSAVVQLDPASYYDVQSTTPGTNLRIRLASPLVNLSRVVLWTSQSTTDVGVTGDSDASSHTPGISILANSEWSSPYTYDSRTVRRTMAGMYANFYLNGAQSDTAYVVTMTYKGTSGTAYLKQYQGSAYGDYVALGNLVLNGAWQTTSFVTSAECVYDYTPGGAVNLLFEITSVNSVYVDSISICMDSDGDTYGDSYEAMRISISGIGTHIYDLNPFSADTDSDGLNDNVERSNGYYTDPCDPDTDSDGLLDGSERYSYTWSTDDSYLIPDDNTWLNIPISVPAIQGSASAITSFCLVLGIMHDSQYQLEIKIAKGTDTQKTIKTAYSGSGANYFILRNLFVAASPFTSPYTAADLSTGAEWHIYVRDATPGTQGRVEYARLQVNGTTNPLDSDSDDDLILDGEEVEFGADGWYTNPRASDSDSDGVSDRNEIIGDVPCGSATDPTRADTDDDGYNDLVDLYMGDAVLRVTIMEYKTRENVNWGDDDCNIFFVIRYGDQELSTKRMYAHTDVLYYPGWAYDIDIAETVTSVGLEFLAVADNAVFTGDDEKLDVSPSGNLDHDVTWDMMYNSTTLSFQGSKDTLDHDTDAYMKVMLERAVSEKAKVIVINGTGEDGDYGLDAVSTGVYRYSADDQVYLVVLNVTGTSAHFQSGMNAIILPRAIALQCQLNDTLYDLQNISSSPLNGASFYSTNVSSASASGHIIAVISKNVTATQAETILTMLTHNETGGRVGNNLTISSTSLYLLHLPSDILSAIPTSVMNSGLGAGPSFLDPLGTICDIAGMVFDFLVWVATGGVLLLLAHLVKEGLKAISNLVSTAITAVEAAVDRIVDAFCAMVDWVVDLMITYLDVLFSPIVQSIEDAVVSYCEGVNSAYQKAEQDVVNFGAVSGETLSQLFNAANANLFMIILGAAIALKIILDAFTVITAGMTFLLILLISPIIGYIMNEVIKAFDYDDFAGSICESFDDLIDWMEETFGPGENPPTDVQIAWTAFGCCMSVVGMFYSLNGFLHDIFGAAIDLVFSIISTVIGLFATSINSVGLGWLGIGLGCVPLIHILIQFNQKIGSERILNLIAFTFGGIGIYCSSKAI
jgi:hypothetical protein